jgi:hypothetical protein
LHRGLVARLGLRAEQREHVPHQLLVLLDGLLPHPEVLRQVEDRGERALGRGLARVGELSAGAEIRIR